MGDDRVTTRDIRGHDQLQPIDGTGSGGARPDAVHHGANGALRTWVGPD